MRAISASPPPFSPSSPCSPYSAALSSPATLPPVSPNLRPRSNRRFSGLVLQCSSNGQGFGSGGNDSKSILDAFFLGKALAEALNERVEATVGEFLSTFGQWQAEQRKQVEDLQDDVFERAKKAKAKAALEAMEKQGTVLKSTVASAEEPPAVPPSLAISDVDPSSPPSPVPPPPSPLDTSKD